MNLEKLFTTLSAIHPLSENFKAALQKEMLHLSLPKNHYLLEAPKVSDQAHFLEDGFAMTYILVKGRKQVECFWGPGSIVFSPKSFFEQVPSHEFIQLLEQSNVLHFNYDGVIKLLDQFPEANVIYRATMSQYYDQCRDRGYDLQYLNARERLQKLNRKFPGIEQIVPQEYIASYLGIKPQSLSRMKRRDARRT